eukprot:317882_1
MMTLKTIKDSSGNTITTTYSIVTGNGDGNDRRRTISVDKLKYDHGNLPQIQYNNGQYVPIYTCWQYKRILKECMAMEIIIIIIIYHFIIATTKPGGDYRNSVPKET